MKILSVVLMLIGAVVVVCLGVVALGGFIFAGAGIIGIAMWVLKIALKVGIMIAALWVIQQIIEAVF